MSDDDDQDENGMGVHELSVELPFLIMEALE